MEPVKNILLRCLRYPLMAVMLLWALTLPGQEVEVYNLLFHGTAFNTAADHNPGIEDQTALQQTTVQAFKDAKISSFSVLDLQQLVKHFPFVLLFVTPADEPVPAFSKYPSGEKLLTQLLSTVLQPNAP